MNILLGWPVAEEKQLKALQAGHEPRPVCDNDVRDTCWLCKGDTLLSFDQAIRKRANGGQAVCAACIDDLVEWANAKETPVTFHRANNVPTH